jgi:hypothetical protein
VKGLVRGLVVVLLLAVPAPASAWSLPTFFDTGVKDPGIFHSDYPDVGAQRIAAAGGRYAWISAEWISTAPKDPALLSNPRDPEDPGYDWALIDRQVKAAHAAGLRVVLELYDAPLWAATRPEVRNYKPRPQQFADFATAIGRRFSGKLRGLPRVHYWAIWNEPNLVDYIRPQGSRAKITSTSVYRRLLNAGAHALRALDRRNLIIAGGMAPFGIERPFQPGAALFAEKFLCVTRTRPQQPTCHAKESFDIWAVHPYTSGGPDHPAATPDNASLVDLPRMRRTLDAAVGAHHVDTRHRVRMWVSEFAWDTNPPDSGAVPVGLHARWTAEAMYRAWLAGVDTFIWLGVRDYPIGEGGTQSALWFRGDTIEQDTPKPAMYAFRFPFVAYQSKRRVTIWGRTPRGQRGRVRIEQQAGSAWRRLATLSTTHGGVFHATLRGHGRGALRARFGGWKSRPFSLQRPPDVPVYPFGTQ